MKTLPISGVLTLAVVAAAIALAAAFAGSGTANASTATSVVTCTPAHDVSPEIVWGGLVVVLDVDRDQHGSGTGVCGTAACISSGGQCGTCTTTVISTRVIRTQTFDGITSNLIEKKSRKQCSCGYNRIQTISYWVRA